MSVTHGAAFDELDKDSLEAIQRVVELCTPSQPCNRNDCIRCDDRWQEFMAEEDEGWWGNR